MKTRSVYGMLLGSLTVALLAGGTGVEAEASEPAGAEEADAESAAGDALEPLELCGPPSSLLLGNFEDGDTAGWYVGPDPQAPRDIEDLVVPGGPGRSCFAAHTTSPGGPDTAGWLGVALSCGHDVRALAGFRFAIKGSGTFYAKAVTIDTMAIEHGGTCVELDPDPDTSNCSDHYSTKHPITMDDDRWYECSVRFSDLRQLGWGTEVDFDPEAVTGVEIVPGWETAFDLTMDDVRFATHIARTGCRPLEPRHHRRHRH